jgi:hypothetical protein
MQAVHSKLSGGCERGVVCAWAFCRTPRVALCGRHVNEVRGQGRGRRGQGRWIKNYLGAVNLGG